MKYEKPVVLPLESAVSAIQGGKGADDPDNIDATTAAAYEADE